jgi:ABC-type nitrate/sulfonate/bicarbonate transport system ATPase subunit
MRTYLFNRRIMLLDEPFGALDAMTRRGLRNWLLAVIEAHDSTVLFVTHDVEEAVLLSDRIVVISRAPGAVKEVVDVELSHPRDPSIEAGTAFNHIKQKLLALIG